MTAAPSPLDAVAREGETSASGAAASEQLRTLGLHSAHYLAGFIGSMLLGLVSFPIFTRVFSVAQFGTIDLAQKVLLIFTAGSKMGLQNAALRFFDGPQFARDSGKAKSYYSTMCFGIMATSGGIAILFLAIVRLSPDQWISSPILVLSYWIALLIPVRALQSIVSAFLRIEERTKAFNIAALATRALSIAAVCALLPWAGRTASTYFAGTAGVETGVVLILMLWLMRRRRLEPGRFDPALFRVGIAFGLPLVVYESAFAVLGSADRFLVRHYLGANALGFYSVAYGLSQTVNDVLVTPLNLALMPIYMRLWTSSGRDATIGFLNSVLNYYFLVAAGILCIACVSARDVVVVLSSAKYSGAERLIPMLLAGLLLYTTHLFVAAGLFLHQRTLKMAGILVFCSLINIGLNCALLPSIGLQGGALATLLSYFLCILLLWRASNRLLPLSVNPAKLGRYAVAAGAAFLSASAVNIGAPILSLAAESAIALLVYVGVLLAIDTRLRRQAAQFGRYAIRLYRQLGTGPAA